MSANHHLDEETARCFMDAKFGFDLGWQGFQGVIFRVLQVFYV